jgi:class 3 adenylate cyclase/tetratricopeptide (TPR) repeat protein
VSTIPEWLASLGMAEYTERFAENGIEIDVLSELTDQDLEKLGVLLGHRRRMLKAIRELGQAPPAAPRVAAAASGAPQDIAERRQLTVMFCDLVGSTALSAGLDPEDLRAIIGAYHRRCTELIEHNGGFVAKYMGDGVLAYFGYPQAHEHDAERGVRAGLALVEAVPNLSTAASVPLQVRVGIATGLVVVGDLIGAGAAKEQAVVGETPNLAARLQALAEPGAVVIAASTRRLTGGLFEYRDLGSVALKGFAESVPAWQVLRVSSAESRFEALRATTTPLVGRDEEIEVLLRRWDQAKRGDGAVVLISGEAGIGKSRIAQTILERTTGEAHTPLRLFCSPHHENSPLYPTISHLERTAGFRREDTGEQRLDKLEAVLALANIDLSQSGALLADLLSIPTGDRYRALNLTPQKRKERTLAALVAQVVGLAAHEPVLMVFEDIHWIDPTSLELLDMIVGRVTTLPVLLIVTFRSEFLPPWVGRPQVTLLNLSRLRTRTSADMIARVAGDKVLPKEIVDQILAGTDGVPLFIEELTKAVLESGVLADVGTRYTRAGPSPPLAIPTTLHASLLARLDRLAPAREVAQIGAALGRQFSHELISAVAQLPQQRIDDALAQLVAAELIFQRGTPPSAEYTFKHALVQDTAYSTLLRSRRHQIHARIADTLETQFPDIVRGQPELLARHCAEAGMADKAAAYSLKAGQQAIARCAMSEAVAQLHRGLDLLSGVPEGAARQEHELNLQITIGQALLATKGYSAPEPGDAFARARYLCEQLNWPPQFGSVLRGEFVFRLVRGELAQAEHHADEIRQLGETRNDVMWKCFGSMFSGNICCWLGKFGDARAHYEKALSLWNPAYAAYAATPEDPYIGSLCHISRALLCLGYVDQARSRTNEALAKGRQISPYNLVFTQIHSWCGIDWATAEEKSARTFLRSADELLAISNEQGFSVWAVIGNIIRGWCLGQLGQAADGIPLVVKGISMARTTGVNLLMPFWLTTLAQTYQRSGQPQEGLNRIAEAIKISETTQERWAEAEIHRVQGTLLLSMHEHAAGEKSYCRALTVARRQNAKFWELRAALDLARLWREQGKRTEARELLAPIYGWFTEGLDTPVLQDAKSLLEQLQS